MVPNFHKSLFYGIFDHYVMLKVNFFVKFFRSIHVKSLCNWGVFESQIFGVGGGLGESTSSQIKAFFVLCAMELFTYSAICRRHYKRL